MSVKKRRRDGTWFYRFNLNKETYQQYGYQTYEEAKNAERDAIKEIQNGNRKTPKDFRFLSVRDACQRFYDEYASKLNSWSTYRPRLTAIANCFRDKALVEITRKDAEKLLVYVRGLEDVKSEQTARHYLAAFKAVINWWINEEGLKFANPFNKLGLDPIPKAKVRFLYPAEEKILTPVAEADLKLWPYYFAGLETGLRLNNLCTMKVKDVDLILRRIFIPLSKNGRSGYVPISDRAFEFFRKQIEGKKGEDLVLGNLMRFGVSKRFRLLVESLEIDDFNFHCLRHTFAYNLLRQGVPIYIVSKLLLHRDTKVTEEHYGHLANDDLAKAVNSAQGYVSRQAEVLHEAV